MNKYRRIILLLFSVFLVCSLLTACGKSNSIEGSWSTTEKPHGYPNGYYYYPEMMVLYKDGTGVCDGGYSLTWTASGMEFTIHVAGDWYGGGTSEYFFSVDGNKLELVNQCEPVWSSEYGVHYTRSH